MSAPPRLGFIGFGEAASAIADGLAEEGLKGIVAFDVRDRPPVAGVTMLESGAAVCGAANLIVAAVTSATAVKVAELTAPHLTDRHVYIDINSVAPETKIALARIVEPTGARFVEAAVMAGVPPRRHEVPILLAGPAAGDVVGALAPFGMILTDVGPELGRAAATKMFRSIVVKGIEALLLECTLAAEEYGVADEVLASVGDGYPGIDWKELADYFASRTAMHGERRAHEMEEVAETLVALGIEPIMASAAARRIRWGGSFGLKEVYGEAAPEDFHAILAAIKQRTTPHA